MCGIVGYVGAKQALSVVVEGLRRLEYRGYDSAGVAVVADGALSVRKRAGKLGSLEELLGADPLPDSTVGIGHTRWATHGAPTDSNAHPHVDEHAQIAVIHNGIIENHAAIRQRLLAKGVHFSSETDTEVVAHLLAHEYPSTQGDLAEAMRRTARQLDGAFTLLALSAADPDVVVGARRNSPLVVGCGLGENFLGSDVAAFISHTREALELGQDQCVELRADSITVTDFDGNPAQARAFTVDWDSEAAEKGGYDLFMLKEIAEQPRAVADTLAERIGSNGQLQLSELDSVSSRLATVDQIVFLACGTAYHAGLVGKYFSDHFVGVPSVVELASEFRYREAPLGDNTLVVAISQSGETMDTAMSVRHAKESGALVISICNTQGSSIPRESDATLYTRAGPEIAVASTKAFLTQVVAVQLLLLQLAIIKGSSSDLELKSMIKALADLPAQVDLALDTVEPARQVARELVGAKSVLYIGRHVGFPVALEGALKLKELAYMHAEGFAAGELKHGPIALIEPGVPVVVIVPPMGSPMQIREKILSNVAEVQARGAKTVVIATAGDEEAEKVADYLIRVPLTPLLLQPVVATVPLQVLACELATAKGHDVDQPRNLAKSVTVE
jgi:glucosamine--fructose-6-phosphate aminotransferase (isomerizing)